MAWLLFLLKLVLTLTAVVVIILVLLQKGKGGGLAGALGGMGGQSAFGTKAGDLFTKITIVVAGVWILTCVIAAMSAPYLAGNPLNVSAPPGAGTPQNPGQTSPPSGEKPATGGSKSEPAGKPAAPSSSEKPGSIPEPSSKPNEKPSK
jgi:preprotein translocase subunit SecG